jgi:hypothetical protein
MTDEIYITQKNIIISILIFICIVGIFWSTTFFLFLCVLILILLAIKYFYNIDIFVKFNDALNELDVDIVEKESPHPVSLPILPKILDEVFNIPGNKYTYEEAETLCKAYGADLASYSQLENAYKDGGEWCNYGWSKDQMALFPTQKSTYDKLQTIKGHENDCGRPGINGGYMANSSNRYGVNCYGKKPAITDTEKKLMEVNKNYPPETDLDSEVDKWKKEIDKILISPFNSNSWYKF